ncbi:MauE/DoxX family redox-associated membrane protein [Sorangium sp. So ce1036]|uniref:MauE/DoxX family redox-associated membrane protein n=1 Tax=Sorangium sp. So ce1036 TaxID=3133328 RepID=UPI003EFC1CEA
MDRERSDGVSGGSGRIWAHACLRLVLGTNIAVHGLARVRDAAGFGAKLAADFDGLLPSWLVGPFGAAVPFLELGIGVAVLLGLRLREALAAGGVLLASLTFGMGLRQQWEVVGLQLVYALAYWALLYRMEDARLTADALLLDRRAGRAPLGAAAPGARTHRGRGLLE